MSDNFEKFINENRDAFDNQSPSGDMWGKIQANLTGSVPPGPAAGGGGIGAAAKIIAAIVIPVAIATAVWFGIDKDAGESTSDASTTPVVEETMSPEQIMLTAINPPDPQKDIPFADFTISAENGGTIKSDRGTVIEIPPAAFVYADGTPVTGDVQISYREFHDAFEIMYSGIPMKVKENGEIHDFQTAGMMEIRGAQNGTPIFVAEGKSLDVKLRSYTDEDGHRLWEFDKEKGWQAIGESKAVADQTVMQMDTSYGEEPVQPIIPVKPKSKEETENLFAFNVDYSIYPELKSFKNVSFEYLNPNDEWVFTKKWSEANLLPKDKTKGLYTMQLKRKGETYEMDVRPVLSGEDLDMAMADYDKQMEQYAIQQQQYENAMAQLGKEQVFYRQFAIYGFGTYNCDRFMNRPGSVIVDADMIFEETPSKTAFGYNVYLITAENRGLVTFQFYPGTKTEIRFFPKEKNYLVTLLPDNKAAVFHAKDFMQLDVEALRASGTHQFEMTTLAGIENPGDLKRKLKIN